MKAKHILFSLRAIGFGSFFFCLLACNKNGSDANLGGIVGKWHESKLVIKRQNMKTEAITDTTYLSNTFTAADYFQFNADGTAVISSAGGVFAVGSSTFVNVTQGNQQGGQLYFRSYNVKGSTLTLQVGFIPTCLNCSQPGPTTETILQLDANNLALQAAPDTSNNYKITTVTWYTRAR